LLKDTPLGQRVVSMKIWKEQGLIAYASNPQMIGRQFPGTTSLNQAWKGFITSEFEDLHDEEDAPERKINQPILEMYVPIRAQYSEKIIAVAEFYETANGLKFDIRWAQFGSWLLVATVSLMMFGTLYDLVRRGSNMIESQKAALQGRVEQLSTLLAQNEELRRRVAQANRAASEHAEQYLRRVGAELHDGPAQLLSLAILRLDELAPGKSGASCPVENEKTFQTIRSALSDSINEIRLISRDLGLPELDKLSLDECLKRAVEVHINRTGADVSGRINTALEDVPQSVKLCLYRFVQEGLNNTFHHAQSSGVGVTAERKGGDLIVSVTDRGTGIIHDDYVKNDEKLGLRGLKNRVETLLGTFEISSTPEGGARLSATFSIDNMKQHHA
jgi:signal transduction histidine kinase